MENDSSQTEGRFIKPFALLVFVLPAAEAMANKHTEEERRKTSLSMKGKLLK